MGLSTVFLTSGFARSLASILVCRFMLALRQFDSSNASATDSGTSPIRDDTASTVLRFGAQPSESLPAFFAHPVHVDWSLSETEPDAIADDRSEWRDLDVATMLEMPLYSDPTPDWSQPARGRVQHSA